MIGMHGKMQNAKRTETFCTYEVSVLHTVVRAEHNSTIQIQDVQVRGAELLVWRWPRRANARFARQLICRCPL